MEKIETLTSIAGRKALQEIYFRQRFDLNRGGFATLATMWRVITSERNLTKYLGREATVLHPLGFFRGAGLWMEETVNRFYFSSINSFVYLGAAALLVLIGIRRFSSAVSEEFIIAGLIFEASMLVLMFTVMFFTPGEEISTEEKKSEENEDILNEIGEIGRDFASAVLQIEQLASGVEKLAARQEESIAAASKAAEIASAAVAPNPEMIDAMRATGAALNRLNEKINELSTEIEDIKKEKIELAVRAELEKYFSSKLGSK